MPRITHMPTATTGLPNTLRSGCRHPEWPFGRILASIRTSCRDPLDVAVTLRDATQRDQVTVGASVDTRTTGVTEVPNSFIVIRGHRHRGASDFGRAETKGAQ